MKGANEMTNDELQRALELGASRVRMAGADLRKAANVLADVADEAARRLRDCEAIDVAGASRRVLENLRSGRP